MDDETGKAGYLRLPAVHGETIAFVCEDDLWSVALAGGTARRLTANLGPVGRPAFSPDGSLIAFTGAEEHHAEVYVMPSEGGPARRLTVLGANTGVRGWTPDGRIVFASDHAQPFLAYHHLYAVDPDGGEPTRLEVGPAMEVAFGPDGRMVIGRHTADPARWKRYRGGRRGDLWVDLTGDGNFRRLTTVDGNLASPMWVGPRVFFLSDHEGVGNLYSCTPTGGNIRRHTDHDDHYARWAGTDGERIVYQLAAEIRCYDPAADTDERVEVDLRSPRVQRNRKFVPADRYLRGWSVHPKGHSVALEPRGKLFTMPLWEEAPRQYGHRDGVRYRHAHWTHDGKHVVALSDEGGEEALEVYSTDDPTDARRLDDLDLGRVVEFVPSPTRDEVAVTNHRLEAFRVDLERGEARLVDRSPYKRITGLAYSPDGRWLAYTFAPTVQTSQIRVHDPESGRVHEATRPDFRDFRPSFDPGGRYLYFLSYRVLDPVYDALFFDAGFPRACRPHLVTLRADEPDPFVPRPEGFGGNAKPKDGERPSSVHIDLQGIADRVLAFPVPEGRYTQVWGIGGKVLFTNFPVSGSLDRNIFATDETPKGKLEAYDLGKLERETLVTGISRFKVSADGTTLVYEAGRRLRALKAGEKPDPKTDRDSPGRKNGWLDLGRARVSVDPPSEWRQMFWEAWRFQRDHFWVPDMSGVDWEAIGERYAPLVEKVATRREFSDLMWETLGELGTSHAYEIGGDVKPPPPYPVGHLGCDLRLGPRSGRWTITHIVRGDSWDPDRRSPLAAPGLGVSEGDSLLAINGQRVDAETSPHELLVNQAGQRVELTVGDRRGRRPRPVVVRALRTDRPARYREWVEANRRRVHEATDGRIGYVHIPDMGPSGYAEFHRAYLAEVAKEGLVVDVRFNSGGHVSELLIEKLARDRIGYDVRRWGSPEPYPSDSPAGPLVCLTNERAGSDGDIFTHVFKLRGLGPVVGTRTWGGVIGITIRHVLVDGGITTQPEHSFWFSDVGWGVENYGTDPTHTVEIKPQDHAEGRDPQMEKAIDLATRALARHRPMAPDEGNRPRLTPPKLPPRSGRKGRS